MLIRQTWLEGYVVTERESIHIYTNIQRCIHMHIYWSHMLYVDKTSGTYTYTQVHTHKHHSFRLKGSVVSEHRGCPSAAHSTELANVCWTALDQDNEHLQLVLNSDLPVGVVVYTVRISLHSSVKYIITPNTHLRALSARVPRQPGNSKFSLKKERRKTKHRWWILIVSPETWLETAVKFTEALQKAINLKP